MPVTVIEQFIFGGVDSRSNPLNMPPTRSLRCRNWVPMQGGWLQLRNGYSKVTMSPVVSETIRSIAGYKTWAGGRFVIFDGTLGTKILNLSTGVVTTMSSGISGTASFALANNRLFFCDGSNFRYWDGTTCRAVGLAPLTDADIPGAAIGEYIRGLSAAEITATIVAGSGAGGSFAATTGTGFQNYVGTYVTGEIPLLARGPIEAVGSRITLTGATSKIAFTVLPNFSTINANYAKILYGTTDGGTTTAFPWCDTSKVITTSARVSNNITYQSVAHGFAANDLVEIGGSADSTYDGTYLPIVSVTANDFTVSLAGVDGTSSGGTAYRYITVPNATTTKNVTANLQAPTGISLASESDYGLAATTIGGAQPGYKFYVCQYNATSGMVSNRLAYGTRYAPTGRALIYLPFGGSGEVTWIYGRTGDGGEVPYVLVDTGDNIVVAGSTATSTLGIDYNRELPTRNTVPISGLDKVIRVGDRMLANASGSPYIFRSESELDTRTGIFFGNPQESWPSTNFETFPTAQAVSCIAEQDQECYAFSLSDMAILIDLAGILQWVGPFNIGCAGQRAFAKTPYGPFWITGEKQLATTGAKGPIIISEEYEAALLSKIGDAYLSQTEVVYFRDATRHIDHIKIKGRDSNGTPFMVIHDFRLRDPLDAAGQGYDQIYLGQLASDFTMAQLRDNNDKLVVYAGSNNGRLYQLESGLTDDGNEYSADYIAILNAGPNRVTVPHMEWFGDANLTVEIGNDLDATTADTEAALLDTNPEELSGFAGRAFLPHPEVRHPYVRLRLTSHSSGNTFDLNDPVHMPLETYGRIWVLRPSIGEQRGGQ